MYKSWAKSFYPDDWPTRQHLEFYGSKFSTIEINATFYRLPQEKTFDTWREQAFPGFLYAIKGSQAVTHFKRLLSRSEGRFVAYDLELEPWAEHPPLWP